MCFGNLKLLANEILQNVGFFPKGTLPKNKMGAGPIVWALRLGLIQDIKGFLRKNWKDSWMVAKN